MTRTRRRGRSRAPALLLVLLLSGGAAADREEAGRLQQAIEALQRQQETTRSERDRLEQEQARLDRRIGELARRLRDLERERDDLTERLSGLETETRRAEDAAARQRRALAALLRAAYMAGREERLKLLLNQQDPALVERMLAYHDHLARARADRIRALQEQLERLDALRREVERRRGELADLERRLAEERRRLKARKAERGRLLAQLEARLREGDRRLRRMREDARRLERLVEEAGRSLQELEVPEEAPFSRRRGRLRWPLAGRLATRFGAEKIGNLRWDGVIIRAPEGREVRAVHGGRVAYADWLRGYGLLLIIDHGDGYMTLYGHNQSLFKEVGDWVREGEVIGLAGRSGGLREPGLYFGIRHEGRPVDPARWCRRPAGRKVG